MAERALKEPARHASLGKQIENKPRAEAVGRRRPRLELDSLPMPDPLHPFLSHALTAFHAGRWSDAEAAARQLLAARPTDVSALHILAASLLNTGNPNEAAAHCHEAIRLDPQWPPPHLTLA